jgi:hypothetical protein
MDVRPRYLERSWLEFFRYLSAKSAEARGILVSFSPTGDQQTAETAARFGFLREILRNSRGNLLYLLNKKR